MNNLINTKSSFCLNFTKKFKCVGLLLLLATLASFTRSKTMQAHKIRLKTIIEILFNTKTPENFKLASEANDDLNDSIAFSSTPLHMACSKDHTEVAQMLIENGANINANNKDHETPLHIACSKTCYTEKTIEIIKMLIKNKALINVKNICGNTPLHDACSCDGTEIAKILIEHGADINATDQTGYTPLHIACSQSIDNSIYPNKIIEILIENGANVNATDQNGETPLHIACYRSHHSDFTKTVQLLLENGANPDIQNIDGQTPAQLTQDEEIQAMLNMISDYLKVGDYDNFIDRLSQKNIELLIEFKNAIFKKESLKLTESFDCNVNCYLISNL